MGDFCTYCGNDIGLSDGECYHCLESVCKFCMRLHGHVDQDEDDECGQSKWRCQSCWNNSVLAYMKRHLKVAEGKEIVGYISSDSATKFTSLKYFDETNFYLKNE